MQELVGKTIVKAEDITQTPRMDEVWLLTTSDGKVFQVSANGAAYCSAYMTTEDVTHVRK